MKIETNSQYHKALAEIETFIEKGFGNLTESETTLLENLSKTVEEFESHKYPMPIYTSIKDILEYYMFENKINKVELSRHLQIPNSTLSEIMNGKKRINLAIAKKLHKILHIDGNFILEMA